jgi:hypothetical protein
MTNCKKCKSKTANFGKKNGKAEYCSDCAPLNYVNTKNKRCIYDGCLTTAIFGKEKKKPLYCKQHIPLNEKHLFWDVKHPTCLLCKKRPVFKPAGSKKNLYCKDHIPEDGKEYVGSTTKLCMCTGCKITASFGIRGTTMPLYCKKHIPEESKEKIINVHIAHKLCRHPNCETIANFGIKGTKDALYCVSHCPEDSKDEYVDVKSKKCLECDKRPSFGLIGTILKLYCKDHVPNREEYEHIKKQKCVECDTVPSYGLRGTTKALYCKDHVPDKIKYTNVHAKKCSKCDVIASYGFAGYSPEYCATHKLPRMVINPKNKPKEEEKMCEYCSTIIHYNEMYCSGCKKYIELKQTVKSHQKELEVQKILDDMEIKYVHDSIVEGGCSKKRPDFLIKTPLGHTIIVEVDENQHIRKTYTCECEITRMKQIYYDVGEEYLLFIRYNPDSYKATEGQAIPKKKRQEIFKKYLKNSMERLPEYNLGVVYLFYDGYIVDQEVEKIEVI